MDLVLWWSFFGGSLNSFRNRHRLTDSRNKFWTLTCFFVNTAVATTIGYICSEIFTSYMSNHEIAYAVGFIGASVVANIFMGLLGVDWDKLLYAYISRRK